MRLAAIKTLRENIDGQELERRERERERKREREKKKKCVS